MAWQGGGAWQESNGMPGGGGEGESKGVPGRGKGGGTEGGTYAVRGAVAEQSPGTKSAMEHHLRRRVSAGQL
jgi:hypothetical protein